ncbi:hypothetical protein, partial [Hornefia butyriciproducens]|uniref:hypothetical protein n=1 Tax=Hornefia butyriciproducens TaxID=2652293 RepID=UPI002A91E5CC
RFTPKVHITILRKDIGDFHLWNADFRLTGMVISNGRTGDGFHSGILIINACSAIKSGGDLMNKH